MTTEKLLEDILTTLNAIPRACVPYRFRREKMRFTNTYQIAAEIEKVLRGETDIRFERSRVSNEAANQNDTHLIGHRLR